MSLEAKIRTIDHERTTEKGIPQDYLDVMAFFNKGLEDKSKNFPYVPRTEPITEKEILYGWMSMEDQTMTYVAEMDGKVVCSATLFLPDQPNEISWETYGHIGLTDDPEYRSQGNATEVLRELLKYCAKEGVPLKLHTAIENKPIIRILEKLGFDSPIQIDNYERYAGKVDGSSHVFEYKLYPEDLKHLLV